MDNTNNQLIVGRNPVFEVLQTERSVNKLYIAEGAQINNLKKIVNIANEKGIITQFVPRKKLDQLVPGANHQGIIAEVAAYDYCNLNNLLLELKEKETLPFILLLDGIEDPHNLGSILRTADIVGVNGIIIPKRRSVGLTATVAKISAGAIEYVPVARVTNLAQTIELLKDKGFWIIGTDIDADQTFTEIDYNVPVCLVIGSEGKGMSRLIKEKCDYVVKMPMKGHINSLNASVAAAIIMYEVFRNRGF